LEGEFQPEPDGLDEIAGVLKSADGMQDLIVLLSAADQQHKAEREAAAVAAEAAADAAAAVRSAEVEAGVASGAAEAAADASAASASAASSAPGAAPVLQATSYFVDGNAQVWDSVDCNLRLGGMVVFGDRQMKVTCACHSACHYMFSFKSKNIQWVWHPTDTLASL
jgi:hypothetical protein